MYTSRDLLDVLTRGGEGWAKFAHHGKDLTPPQIRKLLAAVARAAGKPKHALGCASKFLDASLDTTSDATLATSWRSALAALDDIQKYPFDATKRGKKLQAIAKNVSVLTAWQTAAMGASQLPSAVLALLIIDASDASLDALLPHFDRALKDRDVLASFEGMERYASPRTTPLFARLRSHASAERAVSPVLALGERLGLAKNGRFKLRVDLLATRPVKRSTHDFVSLQFDSHDEPGFSLTTGQQTRTSTSSSSWQRGVTSTLEGLPKALGRLARKAKVEWDFKHAQTRPLGPAKVSALLAWLSGKD